MILFILDSGVVLKVVIGILSPVFAASFGLLFYWKIYYNTVDLTNELRKTYSRNILNEEYQQHCCSCYGLKGVCKIFFWKYLFCYCCCGCRCQATTEATSEEELLIPSESDNKLVKIDEGELNTFCQNYGQCKLKHNNFCKRCKQDHAKTTPVIFLIVLDWLDKYTNLQNYHVVHGVSDKKDCRVDILHAAIDEDKRGLKRDAQTELLNDRYKKGVNALKKDSDSVCLVLKDFPDHWEETMYNEFLVQVDSFIKISNLKLLYTW